MNRSTDKRSQDEEVSPDELFDAIFYKNFEQCVLFFARRGLEREEARDLAQQTMFQVLDGLGKFEQRSSLRTWIQQIAINVWRNWVRDRRTQKRYAVTESLEQAREAGLVVGEGDHAWNARRRDPERESIESQTRERISRVLSRLPERPRQCLELWLKGYKYTEIAERLGISLQTVRTSIHRGKSRVRELLLQFERDPKTARTGSSRRKP